MRNKIKNYQFGHDITSDDLEEEKQQYYIVKHPSKKHILGVIVSQEFASEEEDIKVLIEVTFNKKGQVVDETGDSWGHYE